jgi:hypothetical protein
MNRPIQTISRKKFLSSEALKARYNFLENIRFKELIKVYVDSSRYRLYVKIPATALKDLIVESGLKDLEIANINNELSRLRIIKKRAIKRKIKVRLSIDELKYTNSYKIKLIYEKRKRTELSNELENAIGTIKRLNQIIIEMNKSNPPNDNNEVKLKDSLSKMNDNDLQLVFPPLPGGKVS